MKAKIFFSTLLGYFSAAWGHANDFLAPVWGFIVLVVAFVIIDFITGVQAAKHAGEYEREKASKGWRRTGVKASQYFMLILAAHGLVVVFSIPTQWFPLVYIAAFFIAITELKSISENVAETTGTDIWFLIGDKLRAWLSLKNTDTKG